jgi:hypothetical protein
VKENVLATVGAGIAIEGQGAAERAALLNNEVLDVAPGDGEPARDSALGIFVARAGSAAVVDNRVARVGQALVEGRVRAGIVVFGCEDVRASGNVVDEVGPRDEFLGGAAGIVVVGPFERLDASENSVRHSSEAPAPGQGGWFGLLVQSAGGGLVRIGGGKAVVPLRAGALVTTGAWAYAAASRGDHANIESNTLSGGGDQPTCLVRIAGDAIAQANQCAHLGREEQSGIVLEATSVTAASNRVRGGEAMLVLRVPEDRFAAVGNLTAGGTHLGGPGAGLPSPWDALNPIVS